MFVFLTLLSCIWAMPPGILAANCPDAGVVVVASVFATLAVVFVVLALIGFLMWRRRQGILKSEKPEVAKKGENVHTGFANLAFERDSEDNQGAPYSATFSGNTSDDSDLTNMKELSRKTWSTLPPTDISDVRQRKSSVGSLHRNNFVHHENMVDVQLTSQDFIGLGFKIAGSMRDGIFVSQVHNKGPAKDSGKFTVGDRIMDVKVSFENIVYEDALAILSFASPYPVQVTLQKQRTELRHRNVYRGKENVSHPLYRTQSIDVMYEMSTKEEAPQINTVGQIRLDERDPQIVHGEKPKVFQSSMPKESEESLEEDTSENGRAFPKTNAEVHRSNSDWKDCSETDQQEKHNPLEKSTSPEVLWKFNAGEHDDTFSKQFQQPSEDTPLGPQNLTFADREVVQDEVSNTIIIGNSTVIPAKTKTTIPADNNVTRSDIRCVESMAPPNNTAQAVDDEICFLSLPLSAMPSQVKCFEAEADKETIMHEKSNDESIMESMTFMPERAQSSTGQLTLTSNCSLAESTDTFNGNGEMADDDHIKNIPDILTTSLLKEATDNYEDNNFATDVLNNCSNSDMTASILPVCDETFKLTKCSASEGLFPHSNTNSIDVTEHFPSSQTRDSTSSDDSDIQLTKFKACKQKPKNQMKKVTSHKMELNNRVERIVFENANIVHRTVSYDNRIGHDQSSQESPLRRTSYNGKIEWLDDAGSLDWSGKRLVRSGSFTEIPQADFNWVDEHNMCEDDAVIDKLIMEDLDDTSMNMCTTSASVDEHTVELPKSDLYDNSKTNLNISNEGQETILANFSFEDSTA